MTRAATRSFSLALGLLAAGAASLPRADAHGIWFAQRATQTALIYGVGADDLDSVKRQGLVQSVVGYDDRLQPVPASLRAAGPLLLVDSDADPLVLGAVLFNGIWSKRADGEWIKKGRDEVLDAVVAEKNYKYAVQIRGPLSGPLPQIPGHTLQIFPAGPIPEQHGQAFKLRVMFKGQPVAGAKVLADYVTDPDARPVLTGRDGSATIRVRNQGLNVVTAIFDGPSDEPTKADKMEHLATLSFVLPHAPE